MIIESLLTILFNVLDTLLAFNIGSLPSGVSNVLSTVTSYMASGWALLNNWTHATYLASLFAVVLVVDGVILAFDLVMFIVKKIPFLGVS